MTLTINGVNDAPVAVDDYSYHVDDHDLLIVSEEFGLLRNDYDVDQNDFFPPDNHSVLTVELVQGPEKGQLTLNANGSFVYHPFNNAVGIDYFYYRINDGTETGNIAVVEILIGGATSTGGGGGGPGIGDSGGFDPGDGIIPGGGGSNGSGGNSGGEGAEAVARGGGLIALGNSTREVRPSILDDNTSGSLGDELLGHSIHGYQDHDSTRSERVASSIIQSTSTNEVEAHSNSGDYHLDGLQESAFVPELVVLPDSSTFISVGETTISQTLDKLKKPLAMKPKSGPTSIEHNSP